MILNRDEYFNRINEMLKDSDDENSIKFLEDLTDTYNGLEDRARESENCDWKKRYEENDAAWKKRYKDRFFSGGSEMRFLVPSGYNDSRDEEITEEIKSENITIEDLFK